MHRCYYREEENLRLCLKFLQYSYITVLWIQGKKTVLFVQGIGEIAVISAVTLIPLHQSALDIL